MKRTIYILMILLIVVSSIHSQNKVTTSSIYACPPCGSHCDELQHDKPGVCIHCNMPLVKKDGIKTIAFYLQNGVEVLDFAGPLEVFSYAGYNVFTVSKTKEQIVSQGVLKVIPDYSIDDAPKADILAFFGGNSNTASSDTEVINWVKNQDSVQYHFSVCTGAFILAEAGILKGKTATTFHNSLNSLKENYPETDVQFNARFVDNGNVITTAGISAGIDGALHLVAKLQGLNTAKRTAFYMEYDNWVPGNGLILSDDNPYITSVSKDVLMPYSGKYEYKEGSQLSFSMVKDELTVEVNSITYPLFYEWEDFFTDIDNEPVFFERNDKNEVIGYRLEKEGNLYKRIK
jgi:putative intracellular protease/amidase/DNA-directed RNA polymerase subunit RPC12/RpoP